MNTDFGNGASDQHIFQLDHQYAHFIENKAVCRREGIGKYYVRSQEFPDTLQAVTCYIAEKLAEEYPSQFELERSGDKYKLTNCLRNCALRWTEEGRLLDHSIYTSVSDGLADQVPEDLAIWQVHGEKDYLSTIHLCSPNHWAPADKVGRPFSFVHAPVAGMDALRRRYQPMLRSLLQPKTWVRFAWGLGTDTRLNHHPKPPPGITSQEWMGRSFDPNHPQLYVRVERQTLTGFPEVQAVLFTIRTYFEEVHQLPRPEIQALSGAVTSMSEDALRYKGLHEDKAQLLGWLNSLA
nr:DUF3445 domain-containing protein [Tunicatimonas sp. TK19036]